MLDDRHHRGHRRGDGADRQGVLRRAVRLLPPAQAAGACWATGSPRSRSSSSRSRRRSAGSSAARFADRVGKGIRGAPRDALIADITPPDVRGASFGLRQALDTVGAVGGPLLAIAAMACFAGDFQAAFWVAVVPAFALRSLLLVVGRRRAGPRRDARRAARRALAIGRREAARPRSYCDRRRHRRGAHARALLRGVPRAARAERRLRRSAPAPWVMVVMSVVYAVVAYPAGAAADRGHGPRLLSAGLVALIAADLVLAHAAGRRRPCSPARRCGACTWG